MCKLDPVLVHRPEDADATVETLIVMQYADMGTLDGPVARGVTKGNKVRATLQPIDGESQNLKKVINNA
jgi:hypothetical protein